MFVMQPAVGIVEHLESQCGQTTLEIAFISRSDCRTMLQFVVVVVVFYLLLLLMCSKLKRAKVHLFLKSTQSSESVGIMFRASRVTFLQ